MIKTSGDIERSFVKTISLSTGKSFGEWLSILGSTGIKKKADMLICLKGYYGLSYLQAQLIAGIHFNEGYLVYDKGSRQVQKQFFWDKAMKQLFGEISTKILTAFAGSQCVPWKEHVSFVRIREFAITKVTDCEIRLGLDLGRVSFSNLLKPSEIENIPQNFSHMLTLRNSREFSEQVCTLISKSYNRTHNNEKY